MQKSSLPTSVDVQTQKKIRIVTAASLFDGHDASINIMRRILQSSGAEVIHLGHNRSVLEIVNAALQEDAQAIAISSYQGGHVEYFKYLKDLLEENGAGHIRIYGGGGGVIVPAEIRELESYGIGKIFSPEDGRVLGLQGMIDLILRESARVNTPENTQKTKLTSSLEIGRLISYYENHEGIAPDLESKKSIPVLGITGPGGAGKSSLTDEIMLRFLENNPEKKTAVIAVDPTRKKTGGALLGDRIRMNSMSIHPSRSFMRSMATRESSSSLSKAVDCAITILKNAGFDLIIVETSGIGQSDADIAGHADILLYVMTAEYGAPTQLEKIAMLDFADLVALNKFEKAGSLDALSYVKKQFQRNRELFHLPPEQMPVFPTMASRYNDEGVNVLYNAIVESIEKKKGNTFVRLQSGPVTTEEKKDIIEASRVRYLSEISDTIRRYHANAQSQASLASEIQSLETAGKILHTSAKLDTALKERQNQIDPALLRFLKAWPELKSAYSQKQLKFKVRDRELSQDLKYKTLSGLDLPVVSLPPFSSARELALYFYLENLPGSFPFTAGVFPFRKQDESPTRMFAGEGGPERTNVRFHYLTGGKNKEACRLSTAFDSVTLYGENPDRRPDIYGKIGNSGVSISSLADCKRLYSGFRLLDPNTSVSMTINGPAPMLLAFFFNTAIDQAVETHLLQTGKMEEAKRKIEDFYRQRGSVAPVYRGNLPEGHDGHGLALLGLSGSELLDKNTFEKIKAEVLQNVRGTVQADILKEDQAQNTCIFSTNFALRMMGDMQTYFTREKVRNFYSVSISGYHIAEAGANPITQLAFTLANGFTYVEYYLSRGLSIDDFAANLSFFFSNGLDAEYSVIGRVARRIWAVAMKNLYGASERSQKLKYHIQTSGRSLHAREIDFNDIRTTLQALYAIYDNCNSLHTNAFDEAITTPTEESVRRALAIQMIINQELGLNKNQNPVQGAWVIEELTDLVEEAVLSEFDRLTERGGVIGAMETMYQRSKIQEESLHYEHMKHSGELPIIGVNTFLGRDQEEEKPLQLIRSTESEKEEQIRGIEEMHRVFAPEAKTALSKLKETALGGGNIFEALMDTVKFASLGQISEALYGIGGSYRRNM